MKIRIIDDAPSQHEVSKRNENDRAVINTGLHATRNHIPLISRVLLSAIFLWSGIGKILDPVGTQKYMAAYGMPLTRLFLLAAIAIELGGGLSILLGYKARLGAIALSVFLVVATLIFHTSLTDQIQQIMLMKNLAILGGLLLIIQYGSGQVAIRRD